MKTKNKSVLRTLSKKYQLTIPKKFGEDLGLEPPVVVTVIEDPKAKRIIIEAFQGDALNKADKKATFIEACKILGKKWSERGVSASDVDKAIREFRNGS